MIGSFVIRECTSTWSSSSCNNIIHTICGIACHTTATITSRHSQCTRSSIGSNTTTGCRKMIGSFVIRECTRTINVDNSFAIVTRKSNSTRTLAVVCRNSSSHSGIVLTRLAIGSICTGHGGLAMITIVSIRALAPAVVFNDRSQNCCIVLA